MAELHGAAESVNRKYDLWQHSGLKYRSVCICECMCTCVCTCMHVCLSINPDVIHSGWLGSKHQLTRYRSIILPAFHDQLPASGILIKKKTNTMMKHLCRTSTVFCTGMQRYCQQLWLGERNMWYTDITSRCSIAKTPLHKENWPWKPTGLTVRERIYYPSIIWTRMGTLSVVQIINKNDSGTDQESHLLGGFEPEVWRC